MRKLKLFVSYSHADFKPRPGFKESRVARILADVEYDLDCHSPRSSFEILRDVSIINISENFRHVVQEAIADCDMAIVFFSASYCASEECRSELAQLIEIDKPLFLVDTEPAWFYNSQDDIISLREKIKDILFIQFWENQSRSTVRFGYPLPDVDSNTQTKYYGAIETLVTGIKNRARDLLSMSDRGQEVTSQNYTVFIACSTTDVRPFAARLTSAIGSDKHDVLSFDPELELCDSDSFDSAISKLLAKCDAYIQLLGYLPGRPLPGTDLRLVRAQYEAAKRSGKQIYVWRSSEFEIDECDPEYGAFLKEIALVCHLGNYLEFDTYLRKKLKDALAQRLTEDRRAERLRVSDVKSSWPLVAIDAARADRDLAGKIANALDRYVDIHNLDYDLNAKTLSEAVAESNGLVLAYGESTEGQKRAQAHFNLIRRQTAEIKFKNVELAVGDGAPPTAPPCPRGPNVHVISVADIVDSVAVSKFLQGLGIAVPQ
jgi:hypothetical protein